MGWFDSAETGDSVRPISKERIEKIFDGQGWYYGRDDDDDVCGRWDGAPFFFLFMGQDQEILQKRFPLNAKMNSQASSKIGTVTASGQRHSMLPARQDLSAS